jgi:hypothetical protein
MYKRLHKVAMFSSPVLALYGIAPAYVLNKIPPNLFFIIAFGLSLNILIFWEIHIYLIKKLGSDSYKRYILSYLLPMTIHAILISIGILFDLRPPEVNLIFPFIASIAINTIIIVIANSIVFQFQKKSADIEIERLKVNNLEAQKQALIQQLQPHFLFNALSTLKSLISDNTQQAVDYTVRLSSFLRYSIESNNNQIVPLEQEIHFLKDYIDLQKVRFGEALQAKIDIDENCFTKKLPVYAIQSLVENAIKHNAFTNQHPLQIHIFSEADKIVVSNNLSPKANYFTTGIGLQNLNKRYALLNNSSIEIIQTASSFIVKINLL